MKPIVLSISRENGRFLVDDKSLTGSPPVGRGRTTLEAVGSYFCHNQGRFGFMFEVEPSAQPAEKKRRRRELAKR
jgi:hypothetical protein